MRASQNDIKRFHVVDKQKHMTSTIVQYDIDVRTLQATHGQKRSLFLFENYRNKRYNSKGNIFFFFNIQMLLTHYLPSILPYFSATRLICP